MHITQLERCADMTPPYDTEGGPNNCKARNGHLDFLSEFLFHFILTPGPPVLDGPRDSKHENIDDSNCSFPRIG